MAEDSSRGGGGAGEGNGRCNRVGGGNGFIQGGEQQRSRIHTGKRAVESGRVRRQARKWAAAEESGEVLGRQVSLAVEQG